MFVNPYLFFDGDCEAAFTFYAQTLRGEIEMLMHYGDAPGGDGNPAIADRVIHACLKFGEQRLMGSDACPPQHPYTKVEGFFVCVNVGSTAEAKRIFGALAAGGQVQVPLDKTFFSEAWGMLVDRFGIPWMVNCAREG
ncbi:MAG TPA: VOC family protein [Rhodanobacteraceae bacterium]|nr:VOC family protein [Rhodanobacteraceae bacterium]